MRTYHQARNSELKAEKNTHKGQIAALSREIEYLESIKNSPEQKPKGVKRASTAKTETK